MVRVSDAVRNAFRRVWHRDWVSIGHFLGCQNAILGIAARFIRFSGFRGVDFGGSGEFSGFAARFIRFWDFRRGRFSPFLGI